MSSIIGENNLVYNPTSFSATGGRKKKRVFTKRKTGTKKRIATRKRKSCNYSQRVFNIFK